MRTNKKNVIVELFRVNQGADFFFCRYGLYGNPFEAELFDIEPIIPGRSSSVPVTYANLVAGPNIVFNTPPANNEPAMNGFFSIIKQLNCKELTNKGKL